MSRAVAAHGPARMRMIREARSGAEPGVRLLPGRVIAYAWILAGVPIAALQVVHAGLHEANEPPPIVHWLRDTGLAVPAAAIAVMLAALLVSRAWSIRQRPVSPMTALVWAVIAAFLFTALSLPGHELHGFLFGAEEEEGVDVLADLLGDGLAALQVALLVITPLVLVVGVPWRDTRRDAPPAHASAESDAEAAPGATDGPAA